MLSVSASSTASATGVTDDERVLVLARRYGLST
jgi:hypothetical protein